MTTYSYLRLDKYVLTCPLNAFSVIPFFVLSLLILLSLNLATELSQILETNKTLESADENRG